MDRGALVPEEATSTPITRKRNLHLRSQSRCPSGRFSSSTNIETLEWFVFDHQIRNGDRFGDRLFGYFAAPFPNDLLPRHAILTLFENDPAHDARTFERRLPTTNSR